MRARLVALGAVLAIAGAQGARALAKAEHDKDGEEEPFAPSVTAAPVVTLGYRELAADVFFFRLVGYFGGDHATAQGVASLVEAIVAMDPRHHKAYDWGCHAIVAARHGRDNDVSLRAIAVLERGIAQFPDDYRLPKLAGEIYLFDLATKDEAQKRQWNDAGARLLETAIRKPNAPAELGTLVAHLQSKLGQRQRAIDGLRELILTTSDDKARIALVEKLAELGKSDTSEIAAELYEARKQFETAWLRDRPALPPTMYTLLGPVTPPGFDMRELATGGIDPLTAAQFEHLEPPSDP
ncbi:MAG: hypothetical protein ABI867_30425 [Kofleriaceae bacterium]